ncbi:hypothetical protein MT418_006399 [Batrachochytrium dendrobatidis]
MLSSVDPYQQHRQTQRHRQQYFQDAASSILPGLTHSKSHSSLASHNYVSSVNNNNSSDTSALHNSLYDSRQYQQQSLRAPSIPRNGFDTSDLNHYSHQMQHSLYQQRPITQSMDQSQDIQNQQQYTQTLNPYRGQYLPTVHSMQIANHHSNAVQQHQPHNQSRTQRHQQKSLYESLYSMPASHNIPSTDSLVANAGLTLNSFAKRVAAHLPKIKVNLPTSSAQQPPQKSLQQQVHTHPQQHAFPYSSQMQQSFPDPMQNLAEKNSLPTPESIYDPEKDPNRYDALFAFEDLVSSSDPDEYGFEIYTYMREMEDKTLPPPTLMDNQKEITWKMRRTLVLWLVEVIIEYDLRQETLYLTVNIIDRICALALIGRSQYQLLGITALWIAAKYEENHGKVPLLKNLYHICCSSYREKEFIQMEKFILQKMGFEFGIPTHEFFLKAHCALYMKGQVSPETRALARYILELTIVDQQFAGVRPSVLARASIFLSDEILGNLHWYYQDQYLRRTMDQLMAFMEDPPKQIYRKFACKKFTFASLRAKVWLETLRYQQTVDLQVPKAPLNDGLDGCQSVMSMSRHLHGSTGLGDAMASLHLTTSSMLPLSMTSSYESSENTSQTSDARDTAVNGSNVGMCSPFESHPPLPRCVSDIPTPAAVAEASYVLTQLASFAPRPLQTTASADHAYYTQPHPLSSVTANFAHSVGRTFTTAPKFIPPQLPAMNIALLSSSCPTYITFPNTSTESYNSNLAASSFIYLQPTVNSNTPSSQNTSLDPTQYSWNPHPINTTQPNTSNTTLSTTLSEQEGRMA